MKLRAKLMTAFTGVALMSLIVGIIGLRNMSVINDSTDIMYENELLGLSLIKEANINILYAARAEKNFLLSPTQEQRDEYKQLWDTSSVRAYELLKEAEIKFRTTDGQAAFKKTLDAYSTWLPLTTEVMKLGNATDLQNASNASTLSMGEARAKLSLLDDSMTVLTDRKDHNAKALADEATQIYNTSVILMIFVIIGALSIGVLIGFILSGSVLKTVGGEPNEIAVMANNVANGDLTADTTKANSATGIYRALLIMIEKLAEVVSNVKAATSQVAVGSQQLSSTSQQMSQGASEQAASVEEISASMEEMSSKY